MHAYFLSLGLYLLLSANTTNYNDSTYPKGFGHDQNMLILIAQ